MPGQSLVFKVARKSAIYFPVLSENATDQSLDCLRIVFKAGVAEAILDS